MKHSNPLSLSSHSRVAAVALLGVALTACGTPGGRAQPAVATPPTVTYQYTDDESLIDAMRQAEEYCLRYDAWPRTAPDRPPAGGEVTFICDQERTPATARAERDLTRADRPTVDYPYRDDMDLLEAAQRAQRHCARYGAEARYSTITTAAGSRTVVFECVR